MFETINVNNPCRVRVIQNVQHAVKYVIRSLVPPFAAFITNLQFHSVIRITGPNIFTPMKWMWYLYYKGFKPFNWEMAVVPK